MLHSLRHAVVLAVTVAALLVVVATAPAGSLPQSTFTGVLPQSTLPACPGGICHAPAAPAPVHYHYQPAPVASYYQPAYQPVQYAQPIRYAAPVFAPSFQSYQPAARYAAPAGFQGGGCPGGRCGR